MVRTTQTRARDRRGRQMPMLVLLAAAGCGQFASAPAWANGDGDPTYELVFTLDLTVADGERNAAMRTGRNAGRLRELSFGFDPARFSDFTGDGELRVEDREVVWQPPSEGGTLRYRAAIVNERDEGEFDARITDTWALFRGNDVFPRAASRVLAGSESDSRLELVLPEGWSSVTRYPESDAEHVYFVDDPSRSFDRPTGWIVIGDIGVRRAVIGDTRVAIAAPKDQDFRRMDVMAFLNWTLPGVVRRFPGMDGRLLIVGANDPMWRGGLSGPGSLYMHSDRPLISENGTSTLVHELVHVAMGAAGPAHADWILEGLAEFYSIRILTETGTLSKERGERAMADLDEWGRDVDDLFLRHSTGEVTARATLLFAALDKELRTDSPDGQDLDAVVAAMVDDDQPWDYAALCRAAQAVMQGPVESLLPKNVPGAPNESACETG